MIHYNTPASLCRDYQKVAHHVNISTIVGVQDLSWTSEKKNREPHKSFIRFWEKMGQLIA
ncbi:hypothetical protein PN36_28680 [Candidatus Thiomargarita nelsonii]|uniref:Uncharacterized protein n=1 Tax=Candidatus Thiomargarita nelsonii TaxID=1003181 RepID=A0A4E0QLJ8_9GAMM|nr:hypothetical protein PN36_28680 [Candidatus Thiomargarita nelsonii]